MIAYWKKRHSHADSARMALAVNHSIDWEAPPDEEPS